MRIVVNVWSGLGPPAGIGHYARELSLALQRTADSGDAVSLFPHGFWGRWYQSSTQPPRWTSASRARLAKATPTHWTGWLSWSQPIQTALRGLLHWTLAQLLRRHLRAVHAQWYHEPNFVPLCWDVPTSITVHDVSPILFPEWHPSYRVRWLEKHLPASMQRAQHILTVSQFTCQELVRHFGVPAERIHVTYPGVRGLFRPWPMNHARQLLRQLGLPGDFLLYVGTLEPRKNLECVVRAYLRLPRSRRQEVPFVLVGKYGWGASNLAELIATAGPNEGVLQLGYVPESWLPVLYSAARALVYPSQYEGFGLPPVEMLACGGRVLVSDLPVFRETLGPFASRLPAQDADAWFSALRQLLLEPERTGPNLAAITWAQRFSWENCARQTWQAIKSPPIAVRLAA